MKAVKNKLVYLWIPKLGPLRKWLERKPDQRPFKI